MSASAPVRTTSRRERSTARLDAAAAGARRARLVVVPTLRSSAPRVPFVALVSMLLVGGVVGLLLFNTSMQQASFAASSLEEQADVLDARQQALTQEVEDLDDPQRVASAARELGLVPVTTPAFLNVEDHKVLGEAVPAPKQNPLRVANYGSRKPEALDPPVTVITKKAKPAANGRNQPGARQQQGAGRDGGAGRASNDAGRSAGTNR